MSEAYKLLLSFLSEQAQCLVNQQAISLADLRLAEGSETAGGLVDAGILYLRRGM